MTTLSVPSHDPALAPLAGSKNRPLSTHGLPKPPQAMSLERPHRFSAKSYPPPSLTHPPMSPRSLGPLSPPMSAKSFGTFIDSEPSTPAYSPRIDHEWNNSSLVLVRPMSSSSEPSTPTEPVWRMLEPAKVPSKTTTVIRHPKEPTMTATEIQANTSLASHPNKEAKIPSRPKEIKLAGLSLREGFPPRSEDVTEEEKKSQEQNSGTPTSATFGRFASKMKLMLRRKNTNAKKKQKKKEYEDVERIEDVHWTEM